MTSQIRNLLYLRDYGIMFSYLAPDFLDESAAAQHFAPPLVDLVVATVTLLTKPTSSYN